MCGVHVHYVIMYKVDRDTSLYYPLLPCSHTITAMVVHGNARVEQGSTGCCYMNTYVHVYITVTLV